MAVLAGNSPVQGMRGSLGGLVFRHFQGQTVVSNMPSIPRSRKQTELQELNRSKFKDASRYAHVLTRDPVVREQYRKKAKKMGLPNAYTAALTEYMRKTRVESVDRGRYKGEAGGSIAVVARKKDFVVEDVEVLITTKTGEEVERGPAVKNVSGAWIYTSRVDTVAPEELIIKVNTKDKQGNITYATQYPGQKPFSYYGWKVN